VVTNLASKIGFKDPRFELTGWLPELGSIFHASVSANGLEKKCYEKRSQLEVDEHPSKACRCRFGVVKVR